jgi:hypothetical protein
MTVGGGASLLDSEGELRGQQDTAAGEPRQFGQSLEPESQYSFRTTSASILNKYRPGPRGLRPDRYPRQAYSFTLKSRRLLPWGETLILQWVLRNYTHLSTLRLSPVFRFCVLRCLPLHVAGSVASTAFQRLYVIDDVPRTSSRCLARHGTWMLLLEAPDRSPRTLDVSVLVPQARCAPAGGVHGAAPLRHQGQAPKNQKQQEGELLHR